MQWITGYEGGYNGITNYAVSWANIYLHDKVRLTDQKWFWNHRFCWACFANVYMWIPISLYILCIEGLVQHCGFSRANALEIRPSYTKPLISARMYADTKVYILNEIRFRLIFNPEENMYVVMCSMGENIMDGCGFLYKISYHFRKLT